MQEYAIVCKSMPGPQSEKKTLLPSVIHGIVTEICDIIIYKRGTTGGRTFTTGGRTLESSVTHTFLTPPAGQIAMPSVIHGIITNICDIIIYKRGPVSVTDIVQFSAPACSDLLRPRIKKIEKTRYQRNVKLFIFTFLCLLIGLMEQKLFARTLFGIQRD